MLIVLLVFCLLLFDYLWLCDEMPDSDDDEDDEDDDDWHWNRNWGNPYDGRFEVYDRGPVGYELPPNYPYRRHN